MRRFTLSVAGVSGVALSLCACSSEGAGTTGGAVSYPGWERIGLGAEQEISSDLQGFWRADAVGLEVQLHPGDLAIFETTKGWAVRLPDEAVGALDGALVRLDDEGQTLLATDHPDDGPFVFRRSEPRSSWRTLDEPWTPTERFDHFTEVMSENYAFFEARGVDWEERVTRLRSTIDDTMEEAALFDVFGAMIEDIRDAHLGLTGVVDGVERRVRPGRGPTKRRIREMFEAQSESEDLNAYFNGWYRSYRRGIDEDLLKGRGVQGASQTLRWGWLEDNVAYLQCTSMGGAGGETLEEEIEVFESDLDRALTTLKPARGLVLDLTYNTGGHDAFGRAVASRFAEERQLAFVRRPVGPGDREHRSYVEPTKRVAFSAPVVVLTSDITVSAGETLALYLRVQPDVQLAGTATNGSFSDMLDRSLPGGWSLTLSHQVYETPDGECFEGRGVPVDVPLTVFDPEDPFRGHLEAVESARRLLL